MKKLTIVALIAVAACSQAVVIDDFTSGTVAFSTSALGSQVLVQSGTMASTERDVELNVLTNPFGQFLDFTVGGAAPGASVVSQGFGLMSTVRLQYDVVGDETIGSGTLNNNGPGTPLLSGTDNTIRISFLGNDLAVGVAAVLRNSGSVIATQSTTRAAASGAGNVDLTFGAGQLQLADSITIEFTPVTNADFAINRIEAVPEPSAIAALSLGALALVRRRRK